MRGTYREPAIPTFGLLFTQAANSLLINTKGMSPLKAWGLKLVRQKGRKRATVAVARKLAVILHRMWIDGSPHRWDDVEVVK